MRKEYKPTEAEAEAIDRAGLEAAWRALKPMSEDEEMPVPHQVLAYVRAFKAARNAAFEAKESLRAAHPGAEFVSHYTDETLMVCSALFGIDLDDPSELSPVSIGGQRIAALFQAAKVLEGMSMINCALDDDDGIFGTYLADEATAYAESVIAADSLAQKIRHHSEGVQIN